ncbi:MAG: 4-oxalocrotonate decarboxylase [Bdellovibrionaceae bacterium]|nr:4-oxalocrotonate decarboxylase [Pseudobdellovibrionaceae bacterium]
MKTLSLDQLKTFAETLHSARKNVQEVEPFSKQNGEYNLTDAYKVQKTGIDLRLQEGEKIVGYKMGLTSKAKMEQMGLHTPIFGVLTNTMFIENNGTFQMAGKIHPKTEPEIYFITNRELSGSLDPKDVPAVCEKIGVALEILDSRYLGFKYFSLADVIADNASSAYFVLGDSVPSTTVMDWASLTIELISNGKVVETANGGAILGNPLKSLCELVSLLAQEGRSLPKGSIVLAGAATTAIALESGQLAEARLQNVGAATFKVI